jgi:hypothetical protein
VSLSGTEEPAHEEPGEIQDSRGRARHKSLHKEPTDDDDCEYDAIRRATKGVLHRDR